MSNNPKTAVRSVFEYILGSAQEKAGEVATAVGRKVDDLSGESDRLREQLAQGLQAIKAARDSAATIKPIRPAFEQPIIAYQEAEQVFKEAESPEDPRPALAALPALRQAAENLAALRGEHDLHHAAMVACSDWEGVHGTALKQAVALQPTVQTLKTLHGSLVEAHKAYLVAMAEKDFVTARGLLPDLQGKLELVTQAEVDNTDPARKLLGQRRETVLKMKTDATSKLGGTLPPKLVERFDALIKVTEVRTGQSEEDVDRVVEESNTLMEAVDGEVDTLAKARQTWNADILKLEGAFKLLEAHAESAVPAVKAKIDALRLDIEKSKGLATAHDYAGANGTTNTLQAALKGATTAADNCAKYTAILADREQRVTALANPSGHADVTKLIDLAKKTLDDAKKLATAGTPDYTAAVAVLEPLAKTCIDVAWASSRATLYAGLRKELEDFITIHKQIVTAVPESGRFLKPLEDLLKDSKYETTKDFVKSVTLLERASSINSTVTVAITAFTDFAQQWALAEQAVEDLKAHRGEPGITDERKLQELELEFARDKVLAEECVAAKNVCLKLITTCADLKKKADDYEAFLDEKEQVKLQKDGWDTGWLTTVAELTAQVTRLESEANTRRLAKDYVGARQMMQQALQYAKQATTQIKAQKDFGTKVGLATKAAANADSDFGAAEAEFNKLLLATEAKDTENVYTSDIAKAKDRVEVARLTSDPLVGNPALTKSEMAGAASDLFNIHFWATQREICVALLQDADNGLTALQTPARGDALKDELEAIDKALETADQEINKKNWKACQDQNAIAKALIVKAKKKAQDYDDYIALRDGDIDRIAKQLNNTETKASMATESTAFSTDVKDAATLAKQKKFDEALVKLKKAQKAGEIIDKMVDAYMAARSSEKLHVTDQLGKAKGKPLVADIWLKVEQMMVRLAEMFTKRQFVQAGKYAPEIYWKLLEAETIVQGDAAYQIEKAKAVTAIDDLKKVRCAANEEGLKLAEDTLAKAEEEAKAHVYKNAAALAASVPGLCTEPEKLGKAQAAFDASLLLAQTALTDLQKAVGGSPAGALQVQDLKARIETAKSQALALKLDAAKLVTDGIPAMAKTALDAGTEQTRLQDSAKTLAEAAPDDATGLDDQIADLKKTLDMLGKHAGASAIAALLKTITEGLEAAEQSRGDDVPKARGALAQAAAAAASALEQAAQWAQIEAALKAATDRAGQLRTTHTQPATLAGRFDDADKLLSQAREAAGRGEFGSVLAQLDGIGRDLDTAQAIGEGHARYVIERDKAQTALTDLAKHKNRFAAADDLQQAQDKMVEAALAADGEKADEALKAVAETEALLQVADLKINMSANEAIPEAKIKKLLERKDGAKELDKIIQTLDPKTQRKACQLALELRFDMKLKQYTDTDGKNEDTATDVPAPNIMRLYAVMRDLPDAHTKDNPSVALIKRIGDESGTSSFDSGNKDIELRVGRGTDKVEREIGQAWQVGEVDDNCKPVDDVPPQKFSWTTLHEIGHAVDDKLGFMDKNGSQDVYGGWKVHGRDVGEIAAQVAVDYDYDVGYTEAYLSDPAAKFLPPEPKSGVSPEEWERRRIVVQSWCDSVRHNKSIWYSASETTRLTLKNGRVYQEAYENKWVSYKASKRSEGVAGYQFRAPGEWFAELYAAKHTKKINPNHPANVWLDKL